MKILGPQVGYVDLLNHQTTELLKREAANGGYNKTPIRPSAAGKCTRELFYELMEFHGQAKYEKELKTPSVHRLLNLGHSIEWHVVKQFELLKEFFEIRYKQQVLSFKYLEAKSHPEYSQWLEGSLDLVFWSDRFKCVADVKSKGGGWDFKARKSKWDSTTDQLVNMSTVQVIHQDDTGNGKFAPPQSFWVEDLEAFIE
jgi:hypothetical protein